LHIVYFIFQLDLKGTAEDANDKHLPPWAEICQKAGISNTPLSPYATVENISGRNLWLDNNKLLETGFKITVDGPTVAILKEVTPPHFFFFLALQ